MLSVMVVEDNAFFRGVMRDGLLARFDPIRVREVGDGTEALQELATTPADLVFMGIDLRDKSGIRVAEEIKTKNPDSVVIMLSGYERVFFENAAFQAGAGGYICKVSTNMVTNVFNVVSCFHNAMNSGKTKPGCLLI